MPQVRHTTDIRASRERVLNHATTPSSWPRWHVSSVAVSGATDHSLLPGERGHEELKIDGDRSVVTWAVRERVEPRRWVSAAFDMEAA